MGNVRKGSPELSLWQAVVCRGLRGLGLSPVEIEQILDAMTKTLRRELRRCIVEREG